MIGTLVLFHNFVTEGFLIKAYSVIVYTSVKMCTHRKTLAPRENLFFHSSADVADIRLELL